ncbi:MAG: HEPN domain-containing protein [Leptolyngbya sp. RL_3_1]|nr:HEPN domain-containing protein [Leptolyngbya sp. RL_3_1]
MSRPDEIQANLERAESSFQAAQLLLASGFADDAASRAYYAAFHAASALLVSRGLNFNSHAGVLRAISLNFVKTGQLDRSMGKDLNWLAELRQLSDYGELRRVSRANAEEALVIAARFMSAVRAVLEP